VADRESARSYLTGARRTLTTIANAALATVAADGTPWNSAVYVAVDDTLTFFWRSHKTSAHSINLAARPDVSLLVFDSTLPDATGHGVYISGRAFEILERPAIEHALKCVATRRHESMKSPDDFMAPFVRRAYALVPERIWTNVLREEDGHYFDERVELDRDELCRAVTGGQP